MTPVHCAASALSMTERPCLVAFCGTSRLLYCGLKEIFQGQPDLHLIGMVENPAQITSEVDADHCIFLTVEPTVLDLPNAPAEVTAILSRTVQLVLSVNPQSLGAALQHQCAGYTTLNDSVSEILNVVRRVASGQRAISSSLRPLLQWNAESKKYVQYSPCISQTLTERQIDVLTRIARGDSVKEIARDMHLSHKAVDSHKYRIMQKLRVHDRVQITRLAIREGLLTP